MFSICEISVLGRPPSWCTLKVTAYVTVSHRNVHNHGQAANITSTSFAKRKLIVNTLRKVNCVKTTLPNTCLFRITKYNQDLDYMTYSITVNSVAHKTTVSRLGITTDYC